MKNKVAMITGASVGIGRAVALQMAEKGSKLVLLDTNEETLTKLQEELKAYNTEVLTFVCDVSSEESVNGAVSAAIEKFGSIIHPGLSIGTIAGSLPEAVIVAQVQRRTAKYIGITFITHTKIRSESSRETGRRIHTAIGIVDRSPVLIVTGILGDSSGDLFQIGNTAG